MKIWTVLFLLALAPVSACSGARDGEEEKKRIEAIVGEYIKSHPEQIAESLRKYTMEARAREEENKFRESIKQRAEVPIGDSPSTGPEGAAVTLVEFSDFQCPFCSRANEALAALRAGRGGELRLVFKHMPLDSIHPLARDAAMAAMAAGEQGKFWEYRDMLFNRQGEWTGGDAHGLFARYAQELGLDTAKFENDMKRGDLGKRIDDDAALAKKLGVRATPTFFMNGVMIQGARDAAYFGKVMDALMAQEKGKPGEKG